MAASNFSPSMAAKLGYGKTWVANVVFCFFLFSVRMMMAGQDTGIGATTRSGRNVSFSQELKVQKLLKTLNKPPAKSIKSPDGDIIDCVHILNQPAFDHPKLKNHKIQMRPNFYPEGRMLEESKVSSKSKPIAQLWHQSGSCPEGTIPIRRIRKDDILRASSIPQFGKKNHNSIPLPRYVGTQSDHQYAMIYVVGDKYHGAKASINVWKPNVQQSNEFSVSQIWILNDPDGKHLNSIEAGWQVHPQLYGDNNTRLFTFWTGGKGIGCFDLLCSGFIQLDNGIAMGASIQPLSVYGDDNSQYAITILIWKDPNEGNWWMQYGSDKLVGYWPASLFSHLSDSASVIEWGGEVVNSQSDGQHTTTQMGSGHFPEEGFGKASFFKDIRIVNGDNQLMPLNNFVTYHGQANCYNVENDYSDDWGNHFYYGGPGRNPNCP